MVGCSIRKCKNRSVKDGNIRFFTFPKEESVATEWLRFCGSKTTVKNGRVCSDHFTSNDYIQSLQNILMQTSSRKGRILKPDAIPTLQLSHVNTQNTTLPIETTTTLPMETSPSEILLNNISSSPTNQFGSSEVIVKREIEIEIPAATDMNDCLNNHTTPSNNVKNPTNNIWESDDEITIPMAEYKLLRKKLNEFQVFRNNLERIFTPGQIRCLMKPTKRRIKWSTEDISAAISLRNISPKGYHYLKATVGIPLPGFSTLCKWASKFKIEKACTDVPELMDHVQALLPLHKEKRKKSSKLKE